MYITHGMIINERIRSDAVMSDLDFFSAEINDWKTSPQRIDALTGDRYYKGDHDILRRKRVSIGNDGKPYETKRLPNNKVVDNQYGKLVDQKKNYLLAKEITFDTKNEDYALQLSKIFNRKMLRLIKLAGQDAINGGIAWIYPEIVGGELKLRVFPAYEILPFWRDSEHTELDCVVRYYTAEYYDVNKTKKQLELVEIYKQDGVERYRLDNGVLKLEQELIPYITKGEELIAWDRIPLIPIKANPKEIPLIKRCKELQDAINLTWSNFVNMSDQNPYNEILVIKNYDGTIDENVWQKIANDGIIHVTSVEGVEGGVETLSINVNAENYKTTLDCLKRAMIENCRGFDAKDERMSDNPNQMNIQSMYSDLDLDAEDMENELQGTFHELLWFIDRYLSLTGQGDYSNIDVDVIFNRDILINENEAIENCTKSAGIVSQRTIVSQHPWTKDTNEELKQIQEEQDEQSADYSGVFPLTGNENEQQ